MSVFHVLALIAFIIAALVPLLGGGLNKVGWTAIGLALLTSGFLWPEATI